MSKIVQGRHNGGYADELDGIQLGVGDKLNILWPDGSQSVEALNILSTSAKDEPRNIASPDIEISKAMIHAKHHGLTVDVFLRGLEAERV